MKTKVKIILGKALMQGTLTMLSLVLSNAVLADQKISPSEVYDPHDFDLCPGPQTKSIFQIEEIEPFPSHEIEAYIPPKFEGYICTIKAPIYSWWDLAQSNGNEMVNVTFPCPSKSVFNKDGICALSCQEMSPINPSYWHCCKPQELPPNIGDKVQGILAYKETDDHCASALGCHHSCSPVFMPSHIIISDSEY